MKIAIIEDEIEQQNILINYLQTFIRSKNSTFEYDTYKSGEEFLSHFEKGKYDLLFMDIEFGKDTINGMETSVKLRKLDDDVLLVFVTNMAQFAVDGYSVNAVDFIVKPILYDPFRMKMEKVYKILNSKFHMTNVLISVENASKQILGRDILYVEVNNHDLFYHTKEKEYKVHASLKSAISQLQSLSFCQCNSCYLVNLEYVERIEKDFVVLTNNEKLKMPRTRRKEFLEALGNYLSGARR